MGGRSVFGPCECYPDRRIKIIEPRTRRGDAINRRKIMSEKMSKLKAFCGSVWGGIDAARRVFVNLLFVALVIIL